MVGARRGIKYGDAMVMDVLDRDGLVCGFDGVSMGGATERYQATVLALSRSAGVARLVSPVKRPSRPGHASRLGVAMDGTQRTRSGAS